MSFIADKIVMDGLTYDDVLLIPAYSEVLPKTVELTTKFSRNIELKVPFVTAAMDTVTEAKMAIAIAREGGIGVIHKNMSIEEQARQVAIVKRAENGMIYDPVTIKRGSTVRDALALMSEYRIGGIPVVDDERYLVGIVTNRDLRFEKDMDKRIDEVMTKENIVTTNQSTDMEAASRIPTPSCICSASMRPASVMTPSAMSSSPRRRFVSFCCLSACPSWSSVMRPASISTSPNRL